MSSPRNNRRLQQKKSTKTSKSPSTTSPPGVSPSQLLHQRVSQIENALENMARLSDGNARIFSDSSKVLEGANHVMQKVMNDVFHSTPLTGADGDINFQQYFLDYWTCMVFIDFAVWLGSLAPKEVEEKTPGVILHASDAGDQPIVFGGP